MVSFASASFSEGEGTTGGREWSRADTADGAPQLCNHPNQATEALCGRNSALISFCPLAAASHALGHAAGCKRLRTVDNPKNPLTNSLPAVLCPHAASITLEAKSHPWWVAQLAVRCPMERMPSRAHNFVQFPGPCFLLKFCDAGGGA